MTTYAITVQPSAVLTYTVVSTVVFISIFITLSSFAIPSVHIIRLLYYTVYDQYQTFSYHVTRLFALYS